MVESFSCLAEQLVLESLAMEQDAEKVILLSHFDLSKINKCSIYFTYTMKRHLTYVWKEFER